MEQRERENVNFRSKYGRLLTFSLGLILIYQLIPDGIETVYFWLLLICYTIGAIITWTDELKNNLIKALILFLLDGVIISFVIPGLNIGNDIHKLLIIIFITAYFIGSLYAALICEFISFLYKSYIRVRLPDSIQYNIDKLIQFTSCLNPLGVLIYLGSSLTFLPRVEGISRPIEMTFSDISDFLVAIKNEVSRLLPTEINNSLSQIQHQITSLLIDPLIQYIHLDKIIGLVLLIVLLFISIYISIFIEKRTQGIKKECIEICKDYLSISYAHLNLIYNLLLIFLIIYFSIYGVSNYDGFLF